MFKTSKTKELEREIRRLEHLVKAHETAYNELVEFYDKRNKELEDDVRKLPVSINFGAMDVVSVERTLHNGVMPVTVVGYKNNERVIDEKCNGTTKVSVSTTNSKVKEWYLQCNEDIHNDLVKQFNEYIESRKKVMF